jgi:type II restriction/modification system DNA methylase subunit YeeA
METERAKRLADFVSWVGANIRGDEKGEAQVYLDRLFQGFGHAGAREAGAILEDRIKKADGKGTSFADLVWKPVVLIEMKKRGEDLTRHYRQAFDYWTRLVPGRPRYVMLCNFDEFWVYDFDTQMDAPVDRIKLTELGTRWGALGFLFPTPLKPIFGNDQVAVTRKAADQLADCFNKIVDKNRPGGTIDRPHAQRFVLQMLVALFAEDIGMLPRYMVAQLLEECKTKQDSRDLIGGLFEAMNRPTKTADDRYHGVDYFNGGLFADPARLELRLDEVSLLKAASKEDWSKVRPEIFGTLFEHSLGQVERHAFGAHFTHPTDIMKIVGPTIVEPWRKLIEEATTLKRLRDLWQRMQVYTVLDPACGSGNFLYIAYRELKRLEARLFERMTELSGRYDPSQSLFGFVSARQFFGLDINPFAVELAKVTMMIARKLAIDELHITERALPLDNLDDNFKAADALIDELGNPALWPRADVIIGNPPFLGSRYLAKERSYEYAQKIHTLLPDVPQNGRLLRVLDSQST